ncbi:putative ankyrin repeat-containing domain, PGG domain, ankyrin repeat-containing domain superfamily [Helianthus annuus]|nr:putative ankyrin repeat-containing domain, PGG domain, ankyrin repeat-containing domain superfamily [Helianthus annuus]KAJ0596464.1 putative ankyrin repeat-containing domain, PGG domain, ankyrin repeat-containing domain superfamily [Helianthus annuus]KAJ0757123.1 putative ankyrin repeat-containing domain, PGG domain, ankyrin repeat-containing domain superfamily [Helianthus annuus]KAJ0760848.1 putative ankyrin repeat-containing domain, PGG domain, ankyrin repeat-containing domain superfamily [
MAMIGIVPEVFKEENYEFWKICLKSYLVGQGLWDVVSRDAKSEEEDEPQEWQRKNAQALHAIQLACGSQAYSKYKKNTHVSAKFAWDHLAELGHKKDQDVSGVEKHHLYEDLYNAIEDDDMERVNVILKKEPNATTSIVSSHGDTALHIAILSGKIEIALDLVKKIPPEELEISNEFGATPLSLAAITENITLAKAMVEKNNNLVTLKSGNTDQSSLPVIVASMYGRKRMVHYLYSKTPKHLLDPNNPDPKYKLDGVLLLNNLITADFYDIASELLKLFPKLGIMADHHDDYALHKLAHKPSAFASVRIHSPWEVDTKINTPGDHQDEFISHHPGFLHQLGWILLRLIVPDIKHLHDRKLVNDEASNLLGCIFKGIKGMNHLELERLEIDKAVHNAIKHGIVEFVEELLTYNPDFIWRKDKRGRSIFSHAIVLRQEKIFSLFCRLGTKKSIVASRHDIFQNNFLHLAAKLSPPAQLERVSGAALQMQRELQWYKEVESLVQPKYKDQVNESHRKPATLFTQEHKDLAKEGEKWMKNTAGSSMIVGTLIAAVMFTTAFTVPGGNDEKSGLPIMLYTDSNVFMIFMISNGLSLFASTTSVLMFLGILTARYAEDDFLVSLPTKLILGIACLFFSIVTMMISFATALYLELHKTLSWVSIPLILLSTFPVVLFSALQFPLLIEMVIRTYGSSIFDKHSKHASMIKKPQQYPPQQNNDDYSMKVEDTGDSSMNVCLDA